MNEENDLHATSFIAGEQCRLLLPSRPECIGSVAEFLARRAVGCGGCDARQGRKVTMALHEAISNAIVHGNLELPSTLKEHGDASFAEALARHSLNSRLADRQVEIQFDYDGQHCRWTVADQGKGFDFAPILTRQPADDPEAMLSSGRGILIMRSFMDEIRYEDGGRRLLLTLRRRCERRDEARVPTQQPVDVAPVGDDGQADWNAAVKTVATNVSEGGMALIHEKLISGQRIMIALPDGGTIPAEIRHARSLSGTLVEIGCRFLTGATASPSTATGAADAVQRAIGRLLSNLHEQAPALDRREHEREPVNECIEIECGANITIGYTRNLSRGGVAFVTIAALAGEIVITFAARSSLAALRLRACMTRCTRIRDGLYDAAAQFTDVVS
jgi:anti-sigma regulatory factor (Ser/Thr protein kinase)